ncbi:MAG: SDR family NAD(P)-dependent oxidoreductase [Gaiellaceae bacterium]
MELAGKTALVTGAAAGIGRAVAAALAAESAVVVLADVDDRAGEEAAEELGGRFVYADVTRDNDLRAAIAACGELDVLVNNAGGAPEPHYRAAPVAHWTREAERAEVPELVPAEEIAALVLDLVRDDSLSGRVLIRPADGPPELMPVEGPCG